MERAQAISPAPSGGGRGLHVLCLFAAAWTFLLLFVGGLVTSREAGLSVPDWPLSYGHVNPPGWTETPNVREEHFHRLLGWVLGILVVAQAVWIQVADPRRWMRRLGWAALALVIVQGVIGGYFRVVLLQHWMAVVHGVLGQLFFCVMAALALFTSRGWVEGPVPAPVEGGDRLRKKALWALVAVFVQVIFGGIVRHAGTADSGAGGSRGAHSLHAVLPHLVWGLAVAHFSLSAMLASLRLGEKRPALSRPAVLLVAGVVLQLLLGMGAWMTNAMGEKEIVRPDYQVWTATAHQAVGALVLVTALVLWIRSTLPGPQPQPRTA